MATQRAAAVLVASLIAGSSVGAQAGASRALPQWTLEPRPQLVVGDDADSDSTLIGSIADARLLPNGQLVVADGGEFAVLFFDATGRRVAKRGRRGRGPGEFAGRISLATHDASTVAVWDPSQSRWTAVSASDSPMTVLREGARPAWIHAGVLVLGEGAAPAWAPPLLRALADSLPQLRRAFIDETGLLWVHRDAARLEWIAYAGRRAVGRLTLPRSFVALQFSRDRVVGIQTDADDFEQVAVYRFARPSGVSGQAGPAAASPADSGQRDLLRSAMRNAVVAQEMFYAEHSRYTTRPDSLRLELPQGTRLTISAATNRYWFGSLAVLTTGYSCGMIIGAVPPRGWGEGEPRCGW